jgi:hypothetical protein
MASSDNLEADLGGKHQSLNHTEDIQELSMEDKEAEKRYTDATDAAPVSQNSR